MPARLLLLFSIVLAIGAATATAVAQQGPPPPMPDPSIADGSAQRGLDAARTRWNRLKVRAYDYEVKATCFCPNVGWVKVRVRDGAATKASKRRAGDLASVPRLFRAIQREIDLKAHKLSVRYGRRGVPVEVFMDSFQFAIDDERGFDVRRLERR